MAPFSIAKWRAHLILEALHLPSRKAQLTMLRMSGRAYERDAFDEPISLPVDGLSSFECTIAYRGPEAP
jgi:hypothetical protein